MIWRNTADNLRHVLHHQTHWSPSERRPRPPCSALRWVESGSVRECFRVKAPVIGSSVSHCTLDTRADGWRLVRMREPFNSFVSWSFWLGIGPYFFFFFFLSSRQLLRICDTPWTVSVQWWRSPGTATSDWSTRRLRHHYTGSVFRDNCLAAPGVSVILINLTDYRWLITLIRDTFPVCLSHGRGEGDREWLGVPGGAERRRVQAGRGEVHHERVSQWVSVCEALADEPDRTKNTHTHTHTHTEREWESSRVRAGSEQHRQTRHSKTQTERRTRTNTSMTWQNTHTHVHTHTHTHTYTRVEKKI